MKSKGDRYDLMCYLNMKTKRNEVFKRMKRMNESKKGARGTKDFLCSRKTSRTNP